MFAGTGIAFALAFPVWRGIAQKFPATNDAFLRLGGTLNHRPDFRYSIVLLVLLAVLVSWRNCKWRNRWPATAFVLASLSVMNVQVLTGSTIQPEHWAAYYIQPLFLLLAADLCWNFLSDRKRVGALVRLSFLPPLC